MKSKTDPRHSARKLALSSIFCWLFSESNNDDCLILAQALLDETEIDQELAGAIIEGVKKNNDAIDETIQKCAPEWPLDKISKVDLVILRISVFELMFSKNAPQKVAIDEAVELAKEFGNDTSPKFVNGVLGTVVNYMESNKNE